MANTGVEQFLSHAELAALRRPTSEALWLPGRVYCSEDFYELERETLFPRVWVAAGVASALPDPGNVLPVEVAGWPLVFVRDGGGELRCFHNVCRHRGAAVVREAGQVGRVLRCPWHGWTYELTGELKGTPEFAGPGTHDVGALNREQHGLIPVRMARWFDLLFVNLDGKAAPLDEHLQPLNRRFEAFDFSRLLFASSWNVTFPCNWKVAVEGAIEDYHLCWLHSQWTEGAKRADECRVEIAPGCYYGVCGIWRRYADGKVPGRLPTLPPFPGLTGEDASSLFFLNIFPTAVLSFSRDTLYAGVWLPNGPTRTRLAFYHYFVDQGADDPALADSRTFVIDNAKKIFSQDEPIARDVQERTSTRDAIGVQTRFPPFWETALHAFQQHVVDVMQGNRTPSIVHHSSS